MKNTIFGEKITTFAACKPNNIIMKLTVIGAGNMGGALIHGWAKSGKITEITIADKNEETLSRFRQTYPTLHTTTDNAEAVRGADIVVLVVKPWLMPTVLEELKDVLDYSCQIVVSDAANFTTQQLAAGLGQEGQYFYAIPNIAAEFGASMSFIAKGQTATEESLTQVRELYNLVGESLVVTENLVGPGMMMASCGIAYVMRYIRAQMEGGCEMGFYPAQAKEIALNHAGKTADQVQFIKIKQDWEHGRAVYEIEFIANGNEYEYEIDANTGAIVKWEVESIYS